MKSARFRKSAAAAWAQARGCNRAVTSIEYGLLAFMIAVVIAGAVAYAGQHVKQTFCTVAGGLAPGSSPCGAAATATFTGLPPLKAPVVCAGELTIGQLRSDHGSTPVMCDEGNTYYSATSVSVVPTETVGSDGSLVPNGTYSYAAGIQTASGTMVWISATYDTLTGQSSLSPTSKRYSSPRGGGVTCINERLSKLSLSEQRLAGFGKTGEGFWSNAVASICD